MNLVVDFLSLFIPASIGLAGSYWIYIRRLEDRRETLRQSFLSELTEVQVLQIWPLEGRTVPTFKFVSDAVYQNNAGDLALLDEDEVTALVRYYNRVQMTMELVQYHADISVGNAVSFTPNDTDSKGREDSIRTLIDKLELSRQRALRVLRSQPLPKCGDMLAEYDVLDDKEPILRDFELVEDTDEQCVFTQRGEDFFAGNIVLSGEARQKDVLGRDKSRPRRTWERRFNTIKSLVRRVLS